MKYDIIQIYITELFVLERKVGVEKSFEKAPKLFELFNQFFVSNAIVGHNVSTNNKIEYSGTNSPKPSDNQFDQALLPSIDSLISHSYEDENINPTPDRSHKKADLNIDSSATELRKIFSLSKILKNSGSNSHNNSKPNAGTKIESETVELSKLEKTISRLSIDKHRNGHRSGHFSSIRRVASRHFGSLRSSIGPSSSSSPNSKNGPVSPNERKFNPNKKALPELPNHKIGNNKLTANSFGSGFRNVILQRIWLIISIFYLKMNQFKECESSIIEAENFFKSNDLTRSCYGYLLLNINTKDIGIILNNRYENNFNKKTIIDLIQSRKKNALNEFESILDSNHEYFDAIIGICQVILEDTDDLMLSKLNNTEGANFLDDNTSGFDFEARDDDTDDELNNDNYLGKNNDIDLLDSDNDDECYDLLNTQLSRGRTISSDTTTVSLDLKEFHRVFSSAQDKAAAVTRIKGLLEIFVNDYYYFSNDKLWYCLSEIYKKVNDNSRLENALWKTIEIEENYLIRDLRFFEEMF
ncbi:Ypp1p ASCRUDRAFT_74411 [Ascoidea rubescens DSM 1968]|uniref:Cargo-transport protein YPP1 n=1 Tax=Ascoidea rubescens DSM 1968 TaxID=1344418 RepID=A0A1D2VMZ0_9ASCO|nr:hypothetical protein ASCRUDRAFT_74411 [Ascoidea rubescens DSM 1968]ODV62978.1 hypothetical protein ASCRUDRAFT_74411 [Ascoidea rubescens DSM 1968]